ncbi:MAG: hypothetical protein JXP73_18555 [Deltaproteobacteria bacterium]|nr:hypothetical protein [Deltaproteobacteria bacterium]
MLNPAVNLKNRRLAWPTLLLVFCAGCSSGLDNRRGSSAGTRQAAKRGRGQARFRNPQMDAIYKAAKASPRSFDPVYAFAKVVTDACLASLVDARCQECGEGALRYKPRSEIEPDYWPIIEEALSMLEDLEKVLGLTPEQVDRLIATKGRLLWLAGRSVEEQPLIEEYAQAHPNAVAVIRRRLELLREARDVAESEAQCTLSRAKTESAPAAARVDLLTACVALHPRNTYGRSDLLDYPKYLPGLTTAEESLYRANLVQRCEAKAGDEEAHCAEGCACHDKDSGKRPTARCRRICARCGSETAQRLRLCKRITEAPSAVARAPRPKIAPAPLRPLPRAKFVPDAAPPRPKRVDTGRGPKPLEL